MAVLYLFQRLGLMDGEVIEVIIKDVENDGFLAEIKRGVAATIPNSHLSYDSVSFHIIACYHGLKMIFVVSTSNEN